MSEDAPAVKKAEPFDVVACAIFRSWIRTDQSKPGDDRCRQATRLKPGPAGLSYACRKKPVWQDSDQAGEWNRCIAPGKYGTTLSVVASGKSQYGLEIAAKRSQQRNSRGIARPSWSPARQISKGRRVRAARAPSAPEDRTLTPEDNSKGQPLYSEAMALPGYQSSLGQAQPTLGLVLEAQPPPVDMEAAQQVGCADGLHGPHHNVPGAYLEGVAGTYMPRLERLDPGLNDVGFPHVFGSRGQPATSTQSRNAGLVTDDAIMILGGMPRQGGVREGQSKDAPSPLMTLMVGSFDSPPHQATIDDSPTRLGSEPQLLWQPGQPLAPGAPTPGDMVPQLLGQPGQPAAPGAPTHRGILPQLPAFGIVQQLPGQPGQPAPGMLASTLHGSFGNGSCLSFASFRGVGGYNEGVALARLAWQDQHPQMPPQPPARMYTQELEAKLAAAEARAAAAEAAIQGAQLRLQQQAEVVRALRCQVAERDSQLEEKSAFALWLEQQAEGMRAQIESLKQLQPQLMEQSLLMANIKALQEWAGVLPGPEPEPPEPAGQEAQAQVETVILTGVQMTAVDEGTMPAATVALGEVNALGAQLQDRVHALAAQLQGDANTPAAQRQGQVNAFAAQAQRQINALAAQLQGGVNALAAQNQLDANAPVAQPQQENAPALEVEAPGTPVGRPPTNPFADAWSPAPGEAGSPGLPMTEREPHEPKSEFRSQLSVLSGRHRSVHEQPGVLRQRIQNLKDRVAAQEKRLQQQACVERGLRCDLEQASEAVPELRQQLQQQAAAAEQEFWQQRAAAAEDVQELRQQLQEQAADAERASRQLQAEAAEVVQELRQELQQQAAQAERELRQQQAEAAEEEQGLQQQLQQAWAAARELQQQLQQKAGVERALRRQLATRPLDEYSRTHQPAHGSAAQAGGALASGHLVVSQADHMHEVLPIGEWARYGLHNYMPAPTTLWALLQIGLHQGFAAALIMKAGVTKAIKAMRRPVTVEADSELGSRAAVPV